MAVSFGEAIASFGIDASGFMAGVNEMVSGANQISAAMSDISSSAGSASSTLSSAFSGAGGVFSDVVSGAQSAVGALGNFVSGFASIPGAILSGVGAISEWIYFVSNGIDRVQALASSVFDAASSWQQWTVQLTAFLGSGEAASAMLEQLHAFAASTPFDMPGIVSAGEKLLAFGTAAQDVIPTLDAIAGAVYAVGGDTSSIETIINALDRMRDTGQVTMLSLRTFVSQGIPVWQMFADALNTNVAGAMAAVKSGSLSAEQAIQILLDGMRQMGDPALQAFPATYAGAMNTIATAAEDAWRSFTMPIMTQAIPALQQLGTFLGSSVFTNFATTVGTGMATAITNIGTAFSNLQIWLSPVTTAIGNFMTQMSNVASGMDFANMLSALHGALQLIGSVIAPIPTLIGSFISSLDPGMIVNFIHGGIDLLVQAFQGIQQWLSPIGDAIAGVLAQFNDTGTISAAASLWDTLGQSIQVIGDILAPVRDLVASFISSIDVAAILGFVDGIVGFANAVGTQLAPVMQAIATTIQGVADAFGRLFAEVAASGAFQALGQTFLDLLGTVGPLVTNLGDLVVMVVNLAVDSGILQGAFEGIALVLGAVNLGLIFVITGFSGVIAIIKAVADGSAFTEEGLAKLGDQLLAIGQKGLDAVNHFQSLAGAMLGLGTNTGLPTASGQMDTLIGKIQLADQQSQTLNGTWITIEGTLNRIQMPDSFQYGIDESRVAVDNLDRSLGEATQPKVINLDYASITTAHTEVDGMYTELNSLGQLRTVVALNYASITTAHTEIDGLGEGLNYLGTPRQINLGYASITTAHTEIDGLGEGLDYIVAPRQLNFGYASITTAHTEVDSLNTSLDQAAMPRQLNLGYASITSAHTEVDTLQSELNGVASGNYNPQINTSSIQSAIDRTIQAKNDLTSYGGMTVTPKVDTSSIQTAIDRAIQAKNDLNNLNGTSTWTANLTGSAVSGAAGLHTALMSLSGSSTWTANVNTVNTTTNVQNTVINPPTYLMAAGGIISEPIAGYGLSSGRSYLLGEEGPEAVVPLNRGGGGSLYKGGASAPNQLIIQVNGSDWGRELARAMASHVVSEIRLDLG